MKDEELVWLTCHSAALSAKRCVENAAEIADLSLEEFRKRFRVKRSQKITRTKKPTQSDNKCPECHDWGYHYDPWGDRFPCKCTRK